MPALRRADSMRAWGSRYARLVLDRCSGNKREASRVLGISYHTLNSYLRYPTGAAASADEGSEPLEDADDMNDSITTPA